MLTLFYQGLSDLRDILIVAPFAYVMLVAVLRIGGKRTLSKMNAFDFIVTVALGSILASTLLSTTTSISEGVMATLMLVVLQYVVTFMASRSDWFCSVIKSNPRLLVYQGEMLKEAMKSERVAESEILTAVRENGQNSIENVEAVVLENNGSLSVLRKGDSEIEEDGKHALKDVKGEPLESNNH